MARITVDELKRHTGITDQEQLQLEFLESHIHTLAPHIPNWLAMAMALRLPDYQQMEIRCDMSLDGLHKNEQVLKLWRKNDGRKATYLRLVQACLEIRNAQIAVEVCKLAKTATTDSNPHSLERWFREQGLMDRDIAKLDSEGLSTKQAFRLLTSMELKNLGLTLGGRRILEPHVRANEQSVSSSSQASGSEPTSQVSSSDSRFTGSSIEPTEKYLVLDRHLREVYSRTYEARTKWLNIGVQLGVPKDTLESLQRNRSYHDDGDYYREMLTVWIRGGEAKMEDLLEALEGPSVDMKRVATQAR